MSRPSAQTSNWCVEKIEVKVVSGKYIDRAGVVVALVGSDCKVMCLYATCGSDSQYRAKISRLHLDLCLCFPNDRRTGLSASLACRCARAIVWSHAHVSGAHVQVKLHDGGETLVPSKDLEAVLAQKKNSLVKILHGEHKGTTGKLIGIDGMDGIVKMDRSCDIELVDMSSLAVYVADT